MKDALQLIKEKIGEYKTSAVLKIISRITWEGPTAFGFHGQKADQLKLSTFMLSIIAKTAIIHTDESAHKKDQTTFQDIGRLLDIFHDHLHEKQFENAKKKSGKLSAEDLHSFVIRLTQQQLRYQRGFHQELARSLLIYNDLLKQKRQRIDYEKAFHELYGMNLERFLQIAYAIWVSYRELKPDRHRESEIINYCRSLSAFAPSEFICVFERLSVDATKFRELAEKKEN